MHDDSLCVMILMAPKKQQDKETRQEQGPIQRVQEATKLNAETRDAPSQDPRDHKDHIRSFEIGTARRTSQAS